MVLRLFPHHVRLILLPMWGLSPCYLTREATRGMLEQKVAFVAYSSRDPAVASIILESVSELIVIERCVG